MEKKHAKHLMIQGTSSNVGKSLLAAALCRIYTDRGLRVFPFKSQNMALNSFVTPDGFEIGRAQALQAYAAKREPEAGMNPVLLKPEADSSCQIVFSGKPWRTVSAGTYYTMKEQLWGGVCSALDTAARENDLIIIEGAGSPAEINLKKNDIVNMAIARYLNAPVLLSADIDRGGVFAFLYGTLQLMPPEERKLVKGFLINKFRGDIKLLEPGLDMLADLTEGRPTLGVIPYIKDLLLAQEDSVFLDETSQFGAGDTEIVVIHLPHISNYDDFDALLMEKGVTVKFITRATELEAPDWIIIPGTKTTTSDLLWLKQTGLAEKIKDRAAEGTAVTGICGGYQMLGIQINDEEGAEGRRGRLKGLGLLPVKTVFDTVKKTIQSKAVCIAEQDLWSECKGCSITGYEIHMGKTIIDGDSVPLFKTGNGAFDGAVSSSGKIWGSYYHGIFDEPDLRRAWLKTLGWTPEGTPVSLKQKRDEELDFLAEKVRENIDMNMLDGIIGL